MKRTATAAVSLNGQRSRSGNVPENHATRYLCIAPYLRRAMLPGEIIEPGTLTARAPLPVGRTYALRVLYGAEGKLPMPEVDIELVHQHCRAALRQTILRDIIAIAAVVTAAMIAPWSTLVTIVLIITAIVLAKRVRLSSPLVIAAATGVALALIGGWRHTQESYVAPLISLGACFLIYFMDILWSLRQVRHLSRKTVTREAASSAAAEPVVMPLEPQIAIGHHGTIFTSNSQDSAPDGNMASRVYYDKNGIIGAGTSFTSFPLTIPIDKPRDAGNEISSFTAAQLLQYVAQQIRNQGVGDERTHGYARSPGSPNGNRTRTAVHFTYGLPYLNVDTVAAAPLPPAKKHPVLRLGVRYLEASPLSIEDRSPSVHPERNYVRATTAGWDGQLVVSVYVSAALQGHYLRMVIRPYVLAPIISELNAVDELVERNFLICACAAMRMTARQFLAGANRIRSLTVKQRNPKSDKDPRPAARSTRERYAQLYIENMHQTDDADRIIKIVERKIAAATIDFLKEHNVATGEYEAQIIYNIENQVIGGGVINSGTFTNSPVTNVTGQGNTTTASNNPPAK
jgi:hypothetical protein